MYAMNTAVVEHIKIEYIPVLEASKITGLSIQTIRKLGDKKKIKCYIMPSGHRRFNKQDLEKFCDPDNMTGKKTDNTQVNYIYTRVSSKNQSDDLSRQLKYIQNIKPEYSSYTSISDIASGNNFKRKGLQTILDSCIQGVIGEVIIAHKDILSRFGFDLIKIIIEKAGGNVIVIDDTQYRSSEQELAKDVLEIIHIYSYKQNKQRKDSVNITDNDSEKSEIDE
jgi:putative resolvase